MQQLKNSEAFTLEPTAAQAEEGLSLESESVLDYVWICFSG